MPPGTVSVPRIPLNNGVLFPLISLGGRCADGDKRAGGGDGDATRI